MREDIALILTKNQLLDMPRPRCLIYEPLSETEGMCHEGSVVFINECNNFENCSRYQSYLANQAGVKK